MIDHITIYVNNLSQSKAFYEKAFQPLGFTLSFGEEGVFWAFDVGKGCLFEIAQHKENTPITRTHIAFRVSDRSLVKNFYDAAIEAGAKPNGEPGPRPQYTKNYFACFVLDLDGHNIEAMFDVYEEK